MNTISAQELKRHGVAVLEGLLENGPVAVTKHHQPACVVLSVAQYRKLSERMTPSFGERPMTISELLTLPASGTKQRDEIDEAIRTERESWDCR
jgi:prevent-host-death family protein